VVAFGARAEGIDPTADAKAQPAVLVMLRLPAPHYRPDADYLGGYARQTGSAGQRTAEELAARFRFAVVEAGRCRRSASIASSWRRRQTSRSNR
jgi:hypothetical protein